MEKKKSFIKTKLNVQRDKLASPLTCKLAKLCGFDWNMVETEKGFIMAFSQCWKEETPGDFVLINPKQYHPGNPHIPAMSLDLLHRWVREICQYYVDLSIYRNPQIHWYASLYDWSEGDLFCYPIKNTEGTFLFSEYEEALERGLQHALYNHYWDHIIRGEDMVSYDFSITVENMIENIIKNENERKNQDVKLKQE